MKKPAKKRPQTTNRKPKAEGRTANRRTLKIAPRLATGVEGLDDILEGGFPAQRMYLVEGEENGFDSIPRGVYWAVVTLTTVGYGDVTPHTVLGRILACFIIIMGYGIIAVPTGIFSMEGKAGADGKTITLYGHHADPFEGVMKHRAVWRFPDTDTQILEMYGSPGKGKEMILMEITYARKQ